MAAVAVVAALMSLGLQVLPLADELRQARRQRRITQNQQQMAAIQRYIQRSNQVPNLQFSAEEERSQKDLEKQLKEIEERAKNLRQYQSDGPRQRETAEGGRIIPLGAEASDPQSPREG
jgi:hypothetical protein